MDDEETISKPASSVSRMILIALCAIIALLIYDRFSAWRSEACKSHVGESVFIGTRTAIDAIWTIANGCQIKVRDTSDRVFSHISSSETKPDEWEAESGWNMSLDIEKSAREKVSKSN